MGGRRPVGASWAGGRRRSLPTDSSPPTKHRARPNAARSSQSDRGTACVGAHCPARGSRGIPGHHPRRASPTSWPVAHESRLTSLPQWGRLPPVGAHLGARSWCLPTVALQVAGCDLQGKGRRRGVVSTWCPPLAHWRVPRWPPTGDRACPTTPCGWCGSETGTWCFCKVAAAWFAVLRWCAIQHLAAQKKCRGRGLNPHGSYPRGF
jgi:hypothetical protein